MTWEFRYETSVIPVEVKRHSSVLRRQLGVVAVDVSLNVRSAVSLNTAAQAKYHYEAPITLPAPPPCVSFSRMTRADGDKAVLDELSELNEEYRQKNGFVFLVCASGLPADAILALLKARLPNDRDTEVSWRLGDVQ